MNPAHPQPYLLEGALTIHTAALKHEALLQAIEQGQDSFDLSGLDSVDSAGIQLLLSTQKTLTAHGRTVHWQGQSGALNELVNLYRLQECFANT